MVGTHALAGLHGLLHPEGGFTSFVNRPTGREIDRSGFVAALVLRSLRREPDTPEIAQIRRRALDWLWMCRSSTVPGAFTFWPEDVRPAWARNVPPDVDDTAIMLAELFRHGRIDRATAMRGLCLAVLPGRLTPTDAATLPPWVAAGSFGSWIIARDVPRSGGRPSEIVDCCVNTNVVALMAMLDAQHLPGFDAAVETVRRGLSWAGADRTRLASLSPFYPAPASLADAIEHAVECGVEALRDGLGHVRSWPSDVLADDGPPCSSAYGSSVWDAPALGLVRSLAGSSAA